jgi:hypothetical protein
LKNFFGGKEEIMGKFVQFVLPSVISIIALVAIGFTADRYLKEEFVTIVVAENIQRAVEKLNESVNEVNKKIIRGDKKQRRDVLQEQMWKMEDRYNRKMENATQSDWDTYRRWKAEKEGLDKELGAK